MRGYRRSWPTLLPFLKHMSIQKELRRVVEEGYCLNHEEAAALMRRILAHEAEPVQLAALLGAMSARGETAAEIAGFAETMRAAAKLLPLTDIERSQIVDTCGTGGDACGTFNISTAAALVSAAAGAKVAKHGNRAVTSKSGSADVLEALGIPTMLEGEAAADALRAHGFVFLLAPSHHPAMKSVLPIRKALGVRTVFNVLGPLLNPAGARRQVMGVYALRLVPLVAKALLMLGAEHALVVHGAGGTAAHAPGLDELSLSGRTESAEVYDGAVKLRSITPADAGVKQAALDTIAGGDARTNAAILRNVFAGRKGPHRDVVVLNAAAVLYVAGLAADLAAGASLAREAIDAGRVTALVDALSS
jgi:anthranilate phosphoribosyltransferase